MALFNVDNDMDVNIRMIILWPYALILMIILMIGGSTL